MTYVDGGHDVAEAQWEPNVPDALQAYHHHVKAAVTGWTLNATYGVSRWLGLEMELPFRASFISAEFDGEGGQELDDFKSIHHRSETLTGIGDLALGVRLAVIRPMDVPGLSVDLIAGSSLPTGGIEPNPCELGRQGKEHQHMFFGNGIFVPRLGLEMSYAFDSVSLAAWGQARGAFYDNSEDYRPSSAVTGGLNLSSSLGLEQWRFVLQQGVFHETVAQWGDEGAENSGRTDLLAGLAVVYTPHEQWNINLMAQMPWLSLSRGDQFTVPFVVSLGARFTMDLLSPDSP
jgi:hypothetical protein